MNTANPNSIPRAPVVAVMGHIDHGKSTLLLYIRNHLSTETKAALREAGGITQHVSAYEVSHSGRPITFIDTPGHEAFSGIRRRGAQSADIAILIVSAEDGVKPQTLEALNSILQSKLPYIVAITKVDKEGANIDKTKQSLAEHEIYVEGYGGTTPVVEVSSVTGAGISDLLDMIILIADMEALSGDPSIAAQGVVIESNRDVRKGLSATCIIKNGTIKKGMFVVSGASSSPVRIMENFLGKPMETASFSSPIRIIGWDSLPRVGAPFKAFISREEALAAAEKAEEEHPNREESDMTRKRIPVVIKADTSGSLEAVLFETEKLQTDRVTVRVVASGIGSITENDIRLAEGTEKAIVLGFNTKTDAPARALAERGGITIKTFDIIYKLAEWLEEEISRQTPKVEVEEAIGSAKVLKVFSRIKDKQIIGGRVEEGSMKLGAQVKILRREAEIGQGKIRELQQQKQTADEVAAGVEFGALVESKIEIAPGDRIQSFVVTRQ